MSCSPSSTAVAVLFAKSNFTPNRKTQSKRVYTWLPFGMRTILQIWKGISFQMGRIRSSQHFYSVKAFIPGISVHVNIAYARSGQYITMLWAIKKAIVDKLSISPNRDTSPGKYEHYRWTNWQTSCAGLCCYFNIILVETIGQHYATKEEKLFKFTCQHLYVSAMTQSQEIRRTLISPKLNQANTSQDYIWAVFQVEMRNSPRGYVNHSIEHKVTPFHALPLMSKPGLHVLHQTDEDCTSRLSAIG